MHDHNARARQHRHRSGGFAAWLAAAVFFCPGTTLPARADAAHELAIELVKPGREGLELSARLTPDGGVLQHAISWNIRGADGATVYADAAGTADVSLPPGDYVVDARYGATALSQTVSIPAGTRLKVSLMLNAGGLKVEPLVSGIAVPAAAARVRVFSMDGKRLMAVSVRPGEIIRLPEGTYRVESQVSTGNVKAVADVHIKAGRVSTVKIGHKAGLARLAFVGSPRSSVRWEVEDGSGQAIAMRSGLNANVTLRPGTYTARAAVAGELLTATFNIAAGEVRDILLGN